MKKKYVLTVELNVNGKKFLVPLATHDLITLEKYVSFCTDPNELLKFMPNDKTFSVRSYLTRYLDSKLNFDNDPFSIRTSKSKRSNKIKMLYNSDIDVLLADKNVLEKKLINCFNISVEDCVLGNISKEDETFLKQLYQFADKKFNHAKDEVRCKNYDMDDPWKYDEKYGFLLKNPWMLIAVSDNCAYAIVKDALTDDRKRIEFAYLLKQKAGNLLSGYSFDDKQKLVNSLEDEVYGRSNSAFVVRNSIRKSVKEFVKENIPEEITVKEFVKENTPEEITVKNHREVTKREVNNYNLKSHFNDVDPKTSKMFDLSVEIEELSSVLLLKEKEKQEAEDKSI